MIKKAYIVGVLGWIAAMTVSASIGYAGSSLRFKDEAVILARTFTLGDIVTFSKAAPQFEKNLAALPIGLAPRPGQSYQIASFEVNAILEKAHPGITHRFDWDGSPHMRIRGGGVQCDMDGLQQSAIRFLQAWLQDKHGHGSVAVVGDPSPIIVPVGKVTFHPKMPSARPLAKRMPVWIDIFVDDHHYQTVPIWFGVSVQQSVWVLAHGVAANDKLGTEDVVKCEKDIAGLNGTPLSVETLADRRLVRSLPAGAVLLSTDVEQIPAVCNGELVTVIANHGSVQIQIEAVALADGEISQQILVKNPRSGESFRAMVIGNRQAKVN